MTPKQKKFAALAKPRNKITYADKIAGATKAKRGKTKMTKAQAGVAIASPKKRAKMVDDPRMSDQDKALMQKYIGMLPKGSALAGKALDKLIDNSRMSDQDLAMSIFSQMKKAAGAKKAGKMFTTKKKTTARRAGGLTAAVKKIKTGARRRGGTGRGR